MPKEAPWHWSFETGSNGITTYPLNIGWNGINYSDFLATGKFWLE